MHDIFKKFITISLLTFLLSACSTVKKVKVILPASWLDMEKVAENVYVDTDMPETQRQDLLNKIPLAKNNVQAIWGEVLSTPVIFACSSKACFEDLGGGARAHQIFNYIVLSPRALNAELISHEWSHTEMLKRLDSIFGDSDIPSWFNEGVAVVVSNEPRHNEQAWNRVVERNLPFPQTKELETLGDWNASVGKYQKNVDPNEVVVVYATAGHIVNNWYKKYGSQGLTALIDGVKEGQSFMILYNDL